MMHWFGGYGMGGFGIVFMVLFWALVLLSVFYLLKMLVGGAGPGEMSQTPEQILKKRYAAGEIDRKEYEEKLVDLKK